MDTVGIQKDSPKSVWPETAGMIGYPLLGPSPEVCGHLKGMMFLKCYQWIIETINPQ